MLDFPLGIDAELARVAIGTSNNAHPFDQLERKFLDTLIGIANQFQATNTAAISEGDMSAVWVKLPSGRFVLHAPAMVLKLGISFLAWFLLLAIVIEAGNSKPCTIGRSLTSLGIETTSKGVFLSQHFTVGLQVVFGGTRIAHPQTHAFVADELDNTNSLFNGCILLFGAIKLVLVDQHACLLLSRIWVYYLTHVNIQIFMLEERKMNILLYRKIYPPCPSPKSGRPIHPPLQRRGNTHQAKNCRAL